MSDERTVKIGTFPDDGIIEESVEAYRQTVFTCQLDTLNRHPERWTLVELYVESLRLVDIYVVAPFARQVIKLAQDGMAEFGLDDLTFDSARALLAAREAREGEAE